MTPHRRTKMQIGIALLCRLSSSRLPGKHLLEIKGRAVIDYIMDRVRLGASGHPVIVATSTHSSDNPLVKHCRSSGYLFFRGSLEDVAGRFLSCAEHFGWDYIARINGDNLFADPQTIKSMLAIAESGSYDFITNKPGQTFPYGTGIEVVRTSFYKEVMAGVSDNNHREHVTTRLYENENLGKRFVFQNRKHPEWRNVQLALDTHEDLLRFKSILNKMNRPFYSYSLDKVVRLAASIDHR